MRVLQDRQHPAPKQWGFKQRGFDEYMNMRHAALNGHLLPHHKLARASGRWGVLAAVLVTLALLSAAVDGVKQELKDALQSSSKELYKQLNDALHSSSKELYKQLLKSGAGWVKDIDVQHVAQVGSACAGYNSSAPHALHLEITDTLVAPVVILAHARAHYLAKAVLTLHRHWSAVASNAAKFPLYISVDGDHQPTLMLATNLTFAAGLQVIKVQRDAANPSCNPPWDAYCNLALHYKTLLQLFFECLQAPRLIFLEEDLQVSPDFFSYFEATAPLLDQDSSLYCISAWNDQGQLGRASNITALYRTDVFPGLGWLLTRSVGLELMSTWPPGYWDDNHLRKPHIRKGRQCVYPEVPRTHTFGAVGASNGMFYLEHLDNMVANTEVMDWQEQDLSYLSAARYATLMRHWLSSAKPLGPILQDSKSSLKEYCNITQPPDTDQNDVYLTYEDNADFERLGRDLAPMLFSVSGGAQLPRSVYNSTGHGVVIVRCRQRRLFLISKAPRAV